MVFHAAQSHAPKGRERRRRKPTAYKPPGAAISRGAATSAPPEIDLMSVLSVIARSSSRRRRGLGQAAEVQFIGRGVLERLVNALVVVKREVLGQRALRLMPICVPPQIDLFVFHAPPQPFDGIENLRR